MVLTYAWKLPRWPAYASGVWKASSSQLPANVIGPANGAADDVGVPITVPCGPPTGVPPLRGVAVSTQSSSAVTIASPLEVLTIELALNGDVCRGSAGLVSGSPYPDWPPNATSIVIRDFVLLVNVSSHRPQFAPVLM